MRSVWRLARAVSAASLASAALAASGCRGVLGIDEAAITIDAATDASACGTWQPRGFDPCAFTPVLPALSLDADAYLFDTSTGKLTTSTGQALATSALTLTQDDGSVVAVLRINGLTLNASASLRVVGDKPLLIVSSATIAIDGALDVASHIAAPTVVGAGANRNCNAASGGPGTSAATTAGSGGGGGGGFVAAGGHGGTGGATQQAGGGGGTTLAATAIRGGCPGGASGNAGDAAVSPATTDSHALGGAGGGALRLVARTSIVVAGSINANGAGGSGAPTNSGTGGGGGGSGGYVGLDAPSVLVSGTITANGGGGGGGGGTNNTGNPGADGRIDIVAAPGGATGPGSCGQAGGDGSALARPEGNSPAANSMCGGGGGGGGAGTIRITSASFVASGSAKLSPAATIE